MFLRNILYYHLLFFHNVTVAFLFAVGENLSGARLRRLLVVNVPGETKLIVRPTCWKRGRHIWFLVLADSDQSLAAEPGFHSDPPRGGGFGVLAVHHLRSFGLLIHRIRVDLEGKATCGSHAECLVRSGISARSNLGNMRTPRLVKNKTGVGDAPVTG